MAAACPLPGAKFVDLRSSLSVGPTAAAGPSAGPAGASSGLPSAAAAAAKKDWAVLATDLGKRAPLCPRKGGGLDDDACVAAHHVVRGVALSERAGGGSWSAVGAGAAAEGSGGRGLAGRGRHGGGGRGGDSSSAAAGALAEGPAIASEALRRHHECPAWRTATDVSCTPGMNERHKLFTLGSCNESVTMRCSSFRSFCHAR